MRGQQVVLHVIDWSGQDRYYQAPRQLLAQFAERIHNDGMDAAWDWRIDLVDFDGNDATKPIRYGLVDTRLETFALDYNDSLDSIDAWPK